MSSDFNFNLGTLKTEYGSADDLLKVKKSSKKAKKAANNAEPAQVVIKSDAYLTEAHIRHPQVRPATIKSADFYRNGKMKMLDPDRDPDLSHPEYEISPRTIIEPDKDEPATIRLVGKVGEKGVRTDSDLIPPYSKFFLQASQESHSERSQVVETFSESYVLMFGERPPIYNYSGVLLNTENHSWVNDFYYYYDNFLRGTKCAEYNARLLLTYKHSQVEAFMLNMGMNMEASSDNGISLSFSLLIIDRKILKLSQDFGVLDLNGRYKNDENILSLLKKGLSEGYNSEKYQKAQKTVNGENASETDVASVSMWDQIKNKVGDLSSSIGTKISGIFSSDSGSPIVSGSKWTRGSPTDVSGMT